MTLVRFCELLRETENILGAIDVHLASLGVGSWWLPLQCLPCSQERRKLTCPSFSGAGGGGGGGGGGGSIRGRGRVVVAHVLVLVLTIFLSCQQQF